MAVIPVKADGSFGTASVQFDADAPTDSSTMTLPVRLSQLCRSGFPCLDGTTNKRITYSVNAFNLLDGTVDVSDSTAKYNPFSPAVSTGMFDTVAPGGSASESVSVNSAEQALSPALGWMVVSHENKSGSGEAQLIGLK